MTLQAENLGELVDPAPEGHAEEMAQALKERARGFGRLVICDRRPATLKLLKALVPSLPQDGTLTLNASHPKAVEEAVPEVKGRVGKVSPPSVDLSSAGSPVRVAAEIAQGRSLVLATGEPDPLFGYVDARAAAVLSFTVGARRAAFDAREGDAVAPLQETGAYASLTAQLERARENSYLTIVTRGGEPYSVIDGGPKEARGHFFPQELNAAKGIVVGGGGKGYDDTFSGVLRVAMSTLRAVRKGGDILLVGECGEGIGSQALQMQAQGRITESSLRRGFYADGIEEISYLSRLKEDYSVTLLSSLPDLYVNGRFKFRAAKNAPEALQKVFSSIGRGAKVHVFTRAPETLLA